MVGTCPSSSTPPHSTSPSPLISTSSSLSPSSASGSVLGGGTLMATVSAVSSTLAALATAQSQSHWGRWCTNATFSARDSKESKVGDNNSGTSTPTFIRGNGMGGRRRRQGGRGKVHTYQGHQSVAHNLNLNKYIIQNSHSPNPYSQAIVEAHVTVVYARALTMIDADAQGVL
ncbi:hypothetical protein Pelo_17327 [Pelomyxa schiedti]|nr:hypothetical protein Pelo_17327 [Pelomyxa schiedti]